MTTLADLRAGEPLCRGDIIGIDLSTGYAVKFKPGDDLFGCALEDSVPIEDSPDFLHECRVMIQGAARMTMGTAR